MQFLQLMMHIFPALVTSVSAYFYKRESPKLKKLFRRLTFSFYSRKLFAQLLVLVILAFNFCYLQAIGSNGWFLIASLISVLMLSFTWAHKILQALQSRQALGLALLAMLACVVKHEMLPLSMTLYTLVCASFFYPSKRVLELIQDPKLYKQVYKSSDKALASVYFIK